MSKNDLHVLRIAFGVNRGKVKNVQVGWARFCAKFENPSVEQDITFAQYLALTQDEQSVRKARPGYLVGAHFTDGVRRFPNIQKRYLISFDLDTVTPDQMAFFEKGLSGICGYEFLRHTTRKHCPEKPRWRIHIPTTKPVDGDKINALTRILASRLFPDPQESIDVVDVVSHRPAQVSYMPSMSRDQEYRCEVNHGEILDPDAVLAAFPGDWKDITQLPTRSDEKNARASDPNRKMEDPRTKPGLIGAFCKAYDIEAAIAEFLPDVYVAGESSDGNPRYSYAAGTSANGAVVYDGGLFITSHHGSDPIDGSANAWDMVRVHLFGHLDAKAKEDLTPGQLPSFKAMQEFAEKDDNVKAERAAMFGGFDDEDEDDEPVASRARVPGAKVPPKVEQPVADFDIDDFLEGGADTTERATVDKFDNDEDGPDDPPPKPKKAPTDEDREWPKRLTLDKQDELEKTKHNANVIVSNDPRICAGLALNEMSGSPMIRKALRFKKNPDIWQDKIEDSLIGRKWSDSDTSALAIALSAPRHLGGYGTDFSQLDLQQAMLLASGRRKFNPVLDKINLAVWDGVPRVDSLFIDWLRVEDNPYHRELARVWCVAAITRLYEPGHKFDLVPIIGGGQGGGKSSFIEMLAMGFSGILAADFESTQKMVESTRGRWVLEMSELKGLSRSGVEDVKQFISATSDTVRLAYRANEEDFPRRFVIMGTTNQDEYLKDTTGNRRYCPVKSPLNDRDRIDFKGFELVIPQIWAEAQAIYRAMRAAQPKGWLDLNFTSAEAYAEAKRLQETSRETTPQELLAEVIAEWLETPVPYEVAMSGTDNKFEADEGEEMLLRAAVRLMDVMTEFSSHILVRTSKIASEKLVQQALGHLKGWEKMQGDNKGGSRVEGVYGRWTVRSAQETRPQRWIPAGVDDISGLLD